MIYILVSIKIAEWSRTTVDYYAENILAKIWMGIKYAFSKALKYGLVIILLVWYIGEAALAAPQFLPYFNEIGGGSINGYKYVVDSNYDWGQDLYRLRDFADRNFIDKIGVDYFGGSDPKYELGPKYQSWSAGKGVYPGEWLAVSATFLQTSWGVPAHGFKPDNPTAYD